MAFAISAATASAATDIDFVRHHHGHSHAQAHSDDAKDTAFGRVGAAGKAKQTIRN